MADDYYPRNYLRSLPPIQQLNLPAVYDAIDRANYNDLRMDEMRQERDARMTLRDLGSAALQGDDDALAKISSMSPRSGAQIMQQRNAMADHKTKTQKEQWDRMGQEAPLVWRAFEGVQDQAGYDQAVDNLRQNGFSNLEQRLPPTYDPQFVSRVRSAAKTRMDAGPTKALSPGTTLVREGTGEEVASAPQREQQTPLARLIAERDALPANDPRRQTYDAAINHQTGTSKGGVTAVQQRDNDRIDVARQMLDELGLDHETIRRKSAKFTDTGRENPEFDPTVGRLAAQAGRRKTGDDPDFETTYRRINAPGQASPPAGAPRSQGAPAGRAAVPPMQGARQAPDGKWYVPDPNRAGKYLRVEQ